MRIRFMKDYGMYHPGMVTDQIPGGVADLLIRRRIAEVVAVPEPVELQQPEVQAAAAVATEPESAAAPVEPSDDAKPMKHRPRSR